MRSRLALTLMAVASLAACADPAGLEQQSQVTAAENQLAATFASMADSIGQRQGHRPGGPMGFFLDTLRRTSDPAAVALREQSRAWADSARAARQVGDTAAARAYHRLAHEALFDAIAIVLPNAYERTSQLVDTIVARITDRLGDRDAPRIRRVLERVAALQDSAAASAASDEGHALALTIQALNMLHRMQQHLRNPNGQGGPGGMGGGPMGPGGGPMGPGGGPGDPGGGGPGGPGGPGGFGP